MFKQLMKKDEDGILELFKGDFRSKSIPEMLAISTIVTITFVVVISLIAVMVSIPAVGIYMIVDDSESVFFTVLSIAPFTCIVGFIGVISIGYGRLEELSQALFVFSGIGMASSLIGLYLTGSYPSVIEKFNNNQSLQSSLVIFAIAIIAIAIYFVPTWVSYFRGHHSRLAIFFTNLLLGWSVVGWILALIWSGTGIRKNA